MTTPPWIGRIQSNGDAGKMVLIQKEGAVPSCLPYANHRKEGDLTLPEITESAISFLTKGNNRVLSPYGGRR